MPFCYAISPECGPREWVSAMVSLGDVVMAIFELVADFLGSLWPWRGDKKKDKA
jgi:hypothetical protein